MASFAGKWKRDDGVPENLKEFIKATGAPEHMAKQIENIRCNLEIKIDGKQWTMIISTTKEPFRSFPVEFTVGEPYESKDMFGRKTKMITIVDSDIKIKDTWTDLDESVIEIFREVKGKKMFNTFICKGVSMVTSYTRI